MERLLFENGVLLDPEAAAPSRESLLVDGERIAARLRAGERVPRDVVRIDLAGRCLAPGFIDLHFHGELVFAEPGEVRSALIRNARDALRQGATALLPTALAWPPARLRDFVTQVVAYMSRPAATGAHVLGVHLEGPWINPATAGAQPPDGIRPFDSVEAADLFARSEGQIRMVTLAPEVEGAGELMDMLARRDVVAALGHSLADEEAFNTSLARGVTHVTHLFNAMGPLHHRELGPAGLALTEDRVSCDLICDGAHVHPRMVRLAAQVKGEALLFITDRVSIPGAPASRVPAPGDRSSVSFGSGMVRDDGVVLRLPDGRLAGSSLTLDRAARNAQTFGALNAVQAVAACSLRPARLLGLEGERGSLRPGARADLAVLGSGGEVLETWLGGERVYTAALETA